MNREQVVQLCRYIAAACPNQQFDEFTSQVWQEIIPGWLDLDTARRAVIAVKQKQAYVDVSDVIAEARRHLPPVGQTPVRTLLDQGSYRAETERQDAKFLAQLGLRSGRDIIPKAIEGPKSTQAPPGRVILDDREAALRQAATSRRERVAREAAETTARAAS